MRCWAFYHSRIKNLSGKNQIDASCEKMLQKVESSSTSYNKISTRCAGFAACDVTPIRSLSNGLLLPYMAWLPRNINQSEFEVSLPVTCNNLICFKAGLNVDGKTRNTALHIARQQCWKTSYTFLYPFYGSLRWLSGS